uniref:hypothetical protein n=1 Tax=Massilia oculi TaxID=945844 RepID=UPI0036D42D46
MTIFNTPVRGRRPGDLAALVGKTCFEFLHVRLDCFCARSMASAASSSFMRSWNQSDFFSPSRYASVTVSPFFRLAPAVGDLTHDLRAQRA